MSELQFFDTDLIASRCWLFKDVFSRNSEWERQVNEQLGNRRCVLLLHYRTRKCSKDLLKKTVPDLNVKNNNDMGNLGGESSLTKEKREECVWGRESEQHLQARVPAGEQGAPR